MRDTTGAIVRGVPDGPVCEQSNQFVSHKGKLFCIDYDQVAVVDPVSGAQTIVNVPDGMGSVTRLQAVVGPDNKIWVMGADERSDAMTTAQGSRWNLKDTANLRAFSLSAAGVPGPVVNVATEAGPLTGATRYFGFAAAPSGSSGMPFAWTAGFDPYTGEIRQVVGTFNPTNGSVEKATTRVATGVFGGGGVGGFALTSGSTTYVHERRDITAEWVVNNQFQTTADGRSLYKAFQLPSAFATFTSPTTVHQSRLLSGMGGEGMGFSTMARDASGVIWIRESDSSRVLRVNADGDVLQTIDLPDAPVELVVGPDGNVWVAGNDVLLRILTGVKATSTSVPTLSTPQGASVGSPIEGTTGEWSTSTDRYEYQWQVCSKADGSDCTDIPGATEARYTPASTDSGKYVRMASYAVTSNGRSDASYSALVGVAVASPPDTGGGNTSGGNGGGPAPATGPTAAISATATMELDGPATTRKRQKKTYEVFFSAENATGTVTFTFKRNRKKVRTVTVTVQDGLAEYRWKPGRWPRGTTRVSAVYTPAAGSQYSAAAVKSRVKVR